MGSKGYLIPGFPQDDTEDTTPVVPPVLQKDDTGPGFLGTLGQILANLKVGVYRRRPGSSTIPGLSYNDLIAPVREAKERRQLFDTYLGLGKQIGMDTTPFEKMSFGFMGPSPSILKTMGGFLQHSLQYGHRKPLGPTVAETMFPGQQTVITQPERDFTPEGEYIPPRVEQTGSPLTPIQQVYKEFAARATPAEFAHALPTIIQYAPELMGSQGWESPEKRNIINEYKKAYPNASQDIWGQFESYPPYAFTGPQRQKTVAEMRRVLHEDRGERRLSAQQESAERRFQTQEDRYQKKITDEPLERARTTAHATRNSLAGYLTPEQSIQWGTQIDQAQTPDEVARIQQTMGKQLPPEKPFTPQQEWQHVQQLTRGIVENVKSLTALSGYLKGAFTHEQAGQVLNMPSGGTLIIPPNLYSPTRPNVKPAPNEAQVRNFYEVSLATVAHQITELERLAAANPAQAKQYRDLATQYRATLNGIAQDMAGAQAGVAPTAGPPTVQGPAAQASASSKNPMTLAVTEVLEQRGLTGVPDDQAQRKEVLDAIYHTMVLRNYNPQGQWVKAMQAKWKGWTPPAAP